MAETAAAATAPKRGPIVLGTLILAASVANLNLSVTNVALPDIARAFDASQSQLNLTAIAYSLGLASSVLYLGAVGDRYGRKMMLVGGAVLTIPACLLAAFAPTIEVLMVARLFGGLAAGMAFPTTLALITALWSGKQRTRSIALWSGIGGGMSAVGPLASGTLLIWFDWSSVFLLSLPLAVLAVVLSVREVPAHVGENSYPVDHLGGALSAIVISSLVLAINFATVPSMQHLAIGLGVIAAITAAVFGLRQLKAPEPLFDLHYAKRPTFWVAALSGVIVFGSLMGAMFIGQQYLQNVRGYSTFDAGASILPAALLMVLVAPQSAKLVESRGSRFTLLCGFVACFAAFGLMVLLWDGNSPYWQIMVPYLLVGAGVGLAGTPASHSLTGSLPVRRVGMASGTADLQRDLGGAIMQSILGALLTAGYASSFGRQIAASPQSGKVSDSVTTQLEKSYAGAEAIAKQYPQYADQIISAAKTSFTQGQKWSYTVGMFAVGIGALVIWRFFPGREQERVLVAAYERDDAAP